MADASNQDGDLLNAAAAFLAAAARRQPGPLNDEIKLAVERIAKEIKAVRSEFGGSESPTGRIEAIEASLADVAQNEKLLANGLARIAGQTPPFNATITISCTPSTATVKWSVDGTTVTGSSVTASVGSSVSWTASASGYRKQTGELTALSDQTISVTLEEATAADIVLSGSFSDPHDQLKNLVDSKNFMISGSAIKNGSTSYNVNSGTSYGYIQLTTKEQTTLSITASVGSESNYDFGGVYVGTKIYRPTQSQAKNKTTDSNGSYLIDIAGSVSSKAYTMTLQANTTYYLNFFYVKDGSGNSNGDRFSVTEIKYRAVV